MATMLNGAAVMDAALLLIGACWCFFCVLIDSWCDCDGGVGVSVTHSLVPTDLIHTYTRYHTTINAQHTAGNEACPQPQTSEHLAAVEIMRLNNIIILQNKVRTTAALVFFCLFPNQSQTE